ncbi:hypothetical protein HDU67_005069, partial [Dinochytrium kinnereticum]
MRKEFVTVAMTSWFPGHQRAALRNLNDGIHKIDVVLEVRDARIPLSSAWDQHQDSVLTHRNRIVVLNKADLANHNMTSVTSSNSEILPYWKNVLRKHAKTSNIPALSVSAISPNTVGSVLSITKGALQTGMPTLRFLELAIKDPSKYPYMTIVVLGLPNVGKSSLINALRYHGTRKGSALPVAPHAGVTRSVQTRIKISEDPPTYIVDTPGILSPQYKFPIQALRTAVV